MEDKKISSLGNKIDYLRFLHGDINKKDFCKNADISTSKLTKSIKPETYVKTYMEYLKRNKVFGENEQTYLHLGQALILMLKNA